MILRWIAQVGFDIYTILGKYLAKKSNPTPSAPVPEIDCTEAILWFFTA